MLTFRTLGKTEAAHDQRPLLWLHSNPHRTALLLLLALDGPLSRERVAAVFWPNSTPDRSRRALNQAVYDLRRLLGDSSIVTVDGHIGLAGEVRVDALEFERLAGEQRGEEALALYGGEFLGGEHLVDSVEFEHWVERWNTVLRRHHRVLRRRQICELVRSGRLGESLACALAWVAIEPDEDEAHHRVLELLAATGERTEALQHYEKYVHTLTEQGLQPLDETRTLLASLRAGELGPLAGPVVGLPAAVTGRGEWSAPAELASTAVAELPEERSGPLASPENATSARPRSRALSAVIFILAIGLTGFVLGGMCAGSVAAALGPVLP